MISRNRCSFNPILDFDNKLMEGTKKFCKFLEDIISKGVLFYKAAAPQPINLLKRALLLKKILILALSQMLDWVLNTHLSSERLLQECEYMTNSLSLII